MSADNGVEIIKIGRKGRKFFQLGERPPFEIDIIVVQNQSLDVDRGFRNDKDEVPNDRLQDWSQAAWRFVSEVCGTPTDDASNPDALTGAEVLEFISILNREANK